MWENEKTEIKKLAIERKEELLNCKNCDNCPMSDSCDYYMMNEGMDLCSFLLNIDEKLI